MDKGLLDMLSTQLNTSFIKTERVHGGDINETWMLQAPGTSYFLKLNAHDQPDMFEKEFKGLELLRKTGTIDLPRPIQAGEWQKKIFLLMEHITKGDPSPVFWQTLAASLAALHRCTNEKFGLDHDNYIGSLPQVNGQAESWGEFYAANRLLYLVRRAYDEGSCDRSDAKMMERLCNSLDEHFPAAPPSLLHGDLWSGNLMVNKSGLPVIFDPAVYYGHREMDLGMTMLFGGFDRPFYQYYNEAWPLEKGWQERTRLTQLYPLLVHLVLFGGHYRQRIREILKEYS